MTTVREAWPSGQISTQEGELSYIIEGTDDYVAALAAMASYITANSLQTLGGMPLQKVGPLERLAETYWACPISYSWVTKAAGDSTYNFEIGGGSQRLQQSLETVNSYAPPGKTPPDFFGSINVTRGGVEGVDISFRTFDFSETHYFEIADVDAAFKLNVFEHCYTVNNATFKGFDPGQVLFKGAQGSQRGEQPWEITYRFSASKNVTGMTIGNITGIDKNGWDYLWVKYDDDVDATAKQLRKKPRAVYVERVFEYTDLNDLGV